MVAYSPLVKYVAGRMSSGLPAHVEESDLISYGLGGLISAIDSWVVTQAVDGSKGIHALVPKAIFQK